jgi:hypothetical protein
VVAGSKPNVEVLAAGFLLARIAFETVLLNTSMNLLRAVLVLVCLSSAACRSPSIEITAVPEAAPGGPARTERIAGRVKGAKKGQRIVLFARSGTWWVQPSGKMPFTTIRQDTTWESATHMGTEYAALLVDPGYSPPKTTDALPGRGNGVVDVATRAGRAPAHPAPASKKILFSGYEWEVVQIPHDSAGIAIVNSASNAWTDSLGALHLRIVRERGEWTCAEVILSRSLGYGTYSFRVEEIPQLEPGTVFGMFTWDELEAGQDHREMDIELSQWGDASMKNAQFAIQPYYVPANVFRFNSPRSALAHSFQWSPGRVLFTSKQSASAGTSQVVAEHVFTSGIPLPGAERVHINLYLYSRSRIPQQRGVEVVLDKFEYLP